MPCSIKNVNGIVRVFIDVTRTGFPHMTRLISADPHLFRRPLYFSALFMLVILTGLSGVTPSAAQTTPTGPAVRVDISPASGIPESEVSVTLTLLNVTDLYGLQAECAVDPAVLQGTTHADGAGFNVATSFFVDQGFQPDGSWVIAASRLHPNPAITGDIPAFTLHYTAQDSGATIVTCAVLGVDHNGHEVTLAVMNGMFQVGVIAPTPEPVPFPTETPEATPEITETPLPTTTPEPAQVGVISGTAVYQNAPDNAGITVQLFLDNELLAELITTETGAFEFTDVPAGTYQLLVFAPLHLAVLSDATVTLDGLGEDLGSIQLPAGDTDDNGSVDILDASWIGINFGGDAAAAPNADLNRDMQINIRDLALVGGNFDQQAPVTYQQ